MDSLKDIAASCIPLHTLKEITSEQMMDRVVIENAAARIIQGAFKDRKKRVERAVNKAIERVFRTEMVCTGWAYYKPWELVESQKIGIYSGYVVFSKWDYVTHDLMKDTVYCTVSYKWDAKTHRYVVDVYDTECSVIMRAFKRTFKKML